MKKNHVDAVHAAVLVNDIELLKTAIDDGEPFDAPDQAGRTSIFYTIQAGNKAMTMLLVAAGANVNGRDLNGKTPLHFAAAGFQPALAELLLKHGADVDAVDANGNTPLFDAVFAAKGRMEVIDIFLNAEAERHRKNHHGVSPASLAASIANYDIKL